MEDEYQGESTILCQEETTNHSGELPSDCHQTAGLNSNSEEPHESSQLLNNMGSLSNLQIDEESERDDNTGHDTNKTDQSNKQQQTRSQALLDRIYEIIEKRETGQTSKNGKLSKVIKSLKESNEKITEQDILKIQFKIKKKAAEYDSPTRGVWSKKDKGKVLQDARTFSPTGTGRLSLGQALQWQVRTDTKDGLTNQYNKFGVRVNSQDQQQGESSVERRLMESKKSISTQKQQNEVKLPDMGGAGEGTNNAKFNGISQKSTLLKNNSQTHFPLVATQNVFYGGNSPLLASSNTHNYLFKTDASPSAVIEHLHPSLAAYNKHPIQTKSFPLEVHLPGIQSKDGSASGTAKASKQASRRAPTRLLQKTKDHINAARQSKDFKFMQPLPIPKPRIIPRGFHQTQRIRACETGSVSLQSSSMKYGNLFEMPHRVVGGKNETQNAAYTAVHKKRELRPCPVKRLDFMLATTDESSKGGDGNPTLTTNISVFNRNDISETKIAARESILTFTNETIVESPQHLKNRSTPHLVRTSISPSDSYQKLVTKRRKHKKKMSKFQQQNVYTCFGGTTNFKEDMQPLKTKEAQLVEDGSEAHLSLNTVGTVKIQHAASANFLLTKSALQSDRDQTATVSEERDIFRSSTFKERAKIAIPDHGRSRVMTGVDAHSTELAATSLNSSFHRNMQPIGIRMPLHPRKQSQGPVSQTGVSENEDISVYCPELKGAGRRQSTRLQKSTLMGDYSILSAVEKKPAQSSGVKSVAVPSTPKQEKEKSATENAQLTSTASKQQRHSVNTKKIDILESLDSEMVPLHRNVIKARQIKRQSDKKPQQRKLPADFKKLGLIPTEQVLHQQKQAVVNQRTPSSSKLDESKSSPVLVNLKTTTAFEDDPTVQIRVDQSNEMFSAEQLMSAKQSSQGSSQGDLTKKTTDEQAASSQTLVAIRDQQSSVTSVAKGSEQMLSDYRKRKESLKRMSLAVKKMQGGNTVKNKKFKKVAKPMIDTGLRPAAPRKQQQHAIPQIEATTGSNTNSHSQSPSHHSLGSRSLSRSRKSIKSKKQGSSRVTPMDQESSKMQPARESYMMLEEQGDGTAHHSKSPDDETASENMTAFELQRRLMEFDSESEAGADQTKNNSMTKSFSMGDISLNQTDRSALRTNGKWHGSDLTKKQIAVRLLASVARHGIPKKQPSAFVRTHLN